MSDTPRTDENEFDALDASESCVASQFARQLEREVNELKKLLNDCQTEYTRITRLANCHGINTQKS
jgi:hypothetical protein